MPARAPPPKLPRHHVRPNPHRPRPTLRPQRPDPLLLPLVLPTRPRLCHRHRLPSQPLRRRIRPTHKPLSRNIPKGYPLHDPLHRSHLLRRYNPISIHPCWPTNPLLRLLRCRPYTPPPNPPPPIQKRQLHPPPPPLRNLRRPLQRPLLPPNPNPNPLQLHRRIQRHSRRTPHPHRSRLRSHHLPNRRQVQKLPPLHPHPRSHNRIILPRFHLGPWYAVCRFTVPRLLYLRCQ